MNKVNNLAMEKCLYVSICNINKMIERQIPQFLTEVMSFMNHERSEYLFKSKIDSYLYRVFIKICLSLDYLPASVKICPKSPKPVWAFIQNWGFILITKVIQERTENN